eukprot:31237-Pelagococcus_subviridis.AAC.13
MRRVVVSSPPSGRFFVLVEVVGGGGGGGAHRPVPHRDRVDTKCVLKLRYSPSGVRTFTTPRDSPKRSGVPTSTGSSYPSGDGNTSRTSNTLFGDGRREPSSPGCDFATRAPGRARPYADWLAYGDARHRIDVSACSRAETYGDGVSVSSTEA